MKNSTNLREVGEVGHGDEGVVGHGRGRHDHIEGQEAVMVAHFLVVKLLLGQSHFTSFSQANHCLKREERQREVMKRQREVMNRTLPMWFLTKLNLPGFVR